MLAAQAPPSHPLGSPLETAGKGRPSLLEGVLAPECDLGTALAEASEGPQLRAPEPGSASAHSVASDEPLRLQLVPGGQKSGSERSESRGAAGRTCTRRASAATAASGAVAAV